jgi:ankyrin repeat protein
VVILTGKSGTGKTKLVHSLFKQSSIYRNTQSSNLTTGSKNIPSSNSNLSLNNNTLNKNNSIQNIVKYLSSSLACVHICLPDDYKTLDTRTFLKNLAWSLQNFDPFKSNTHHDKTNSYKYILLENKAKLLKKLVKKYQFNESEMKEIASSSSCGGSSSLLRASPTANTMSNSSFTNCEYSSLKSSTIVDYSNYMSSLNDLSNLLKICILDPIESLHNNSTSSSSPKFNYFYVVIDGLDYSDNISRFLLNSIEKNLFPKWFKFLITVRDDKKITFKSNFCSIIKLDSQSNSNSFNITKDLNDYVTNRIQKSLDIQKNILCLTLSNDNITPATTTSQTTNGNFATLNKFDLNFHNKFVQHIVKLSSSNYLYLKLLLDLIERGNLIIKSSNFNAIPKDFTNLLRLYFNLKFKTSVSYDRLASLLFSVLLTTNKLLKLKELYMLMRPVWRHHVSLNELTEQVNLNLNEFIAPFQLFNPKEPQKLITKPYYIFKHSAIRDWWIDLHKNHADKSHNLKLARVLLGLRVFKLEKNRLNFSLINEHLKYIFSGHGGSSILNENFVQYLITVYFPKEYIDYFLFSNQYLQETKPCRKIFQTFLNLNSTNITEASSNHLPPLLCILSSLGHLELINVVLNISNFKLGESCNGSGKFYALISDHNQTNCLSYATKYSQYETCKFLIENSSNPIDMLTKSDKFGLSALIYATFHVSNRILEYYLKYLINKLKSNSLNMEFYKLLLEQCVLYSSINSNLNSLNYLIDFLKSNHIKISIDTIDLLKGETALTIACLNGNKPICELIVEKLNASLHAINSKSWTPLLCAVKSGCWEIVEYLLSFKQLPSECKVINQLDKHGRSALILASSEGHLAIIDILIEKKASLNCQDKDGLSALSWACLKGHYNAALALINHGADVNHADNSGRTALDLATFYGDVKLVQLLLEKGAQIEHVDKIGMRPLDRAIGCRNVPIVVCFLKKGAKLNPATWAMAQGKPEIIITLLNKLVEDGNTLYRVSNLNIFEI